MSNQEPLRLAEGEYRFAALVWDNEPLSSGQLVRLAADALGWKKSTTYIVLKRLEGKGAVQRTDPKYVVSALVSRQQVQLAETSSLVDKMFGGSFANLFANFLSSDQVSDSTLDQLQQMIDEKKKEK